MRRAGTMLAVLALAGCGGGDGDDAIAPAGENAATERLLAAYFERNFADSPWYDDLRGFEVRGGRRLGPEELEGATVVVQTTIAANAEDVAQAVCAGVFGADVVDSGGLVRVVGEGGDDVRTCRSDR